MLSIYLASIAILILFFGKPLDTLFFKIWSSWSKTPISSDQHELSFVQYLILSTRSGVDLRESLARFNKKHKNNFVGRKSSQLILQKKTSENSFVQCLAKICDVGGSALPILLLWKNHLYFQLKLNRKVATASIQSKLQSLTLLFLPILLLFVMGCFDPSLLNSIIFNTLAILLISSGLILNVAGTLIIYRNSKKLIWYNSEVITLNVISSVLNHLLLDISCGITKSNWLMTTIRKTCSPDQQKLVTHHSRFFEIRALIDHAEKLGAPLKPELEQFTDDIRNEIEQHWLEKAESLPIRQLLPLFTLNFPGTLLQLISPLIPIILNS